MTDVLLLVAPTDRPRAELLAKALEAEGFTVRWEASQGEPPSEPFDEIGHRLLVRVTPIDPSDEDHHPLPHLHVALTSPIATKAAPHEGETHIDLGPWTGDIEAPAFRRLLSALRRVPVDTDTEPTPPRSASGERPVSPETTRPRTWRTRLVTLFAIVAPLVAFLGDVAGLQGVACRLPGVYYLCGEAGLGDIPSAAERRLWQAREPGDCQRLRDYLRLYPEGALADAASRGLAARTFRDHVSWIDEERRLPLVTRLTTDPFPTRAAARDDALRRGQDDAERLICAGYSGGDYRLVGATAEAERWNFLELSKGFTCGFDGRAVCQLKIRRVETMEICP